MSVYVQSFNEDFLIGYTSLVDSNNDYSLNIMSVFSFTGTFPYAWNI